MTTLISLERAKLSIVPAVSGDDRLLDVLIGAASRAIEKHCRRVFAANTYDECPDSDSVPGLGLVPNYARRGLLLLSRFPVLSVEAVRHSPTSVLEVSNTDTATNQQARVTVTNTGLELVLVAAGVRTVTSLTYASNVTLSAMATAISAVGSGWTARAADYALWPSQDLFQAPRAGDATRSAGAVSCRGTYAPLYLHVGESFDYRWDSRGWIELRGAAILSDPVIGWPGDFVPRAYYRVQYTAGFVEIPEDVQEACALWVQELYYLAQRDPSITNTLTAAGAATGYTATTQAGAMPLRVRAMIAPYQVRNV